MTCSRIYFRTARVSDREAVLGFSKDSFYWGDYLPNVWDRWLEDPRGKLVAATCNRKPVAVAHYTMIAPSEAWCEGLRVDPTFRQRGIATMIARRTLQEARKLGATVARFATHSTNEPVHRMAAGLGFQKVVALRPWGAEAVAAGPSLLHPPVSDRDRLFSFLQDSAIFRAMGGLCNTGWRFQEMTVGVLHKRMEKGLLRVLESDGLLSAVAMIGAGYGNIRGLAVSYADGGPGALTEMVSGLRAEATGCSPPEVTVWLPEMTGYENLFARDGFTRSTEGIWVYQIKL